MRVGLLYLDALASGGYPRDVRWLAGHLVQAGCDVDLICDAGPAIDGLGHARIVRPGDALGYDILHILGGLFVPRQLLAAHRVPGTVRILSPLAQLSPAHVAYRRWKKLPYLFLLRLALMRYSYVLHSLDSYEAATVPSWLHPSVTFQASLGLFPTPVANLAAPSPLPDVPTRYILFFGRNDIRQKGLDLLLQAYSAAPVAPPLVIAGNDWRGSSRHIRAEVTRLSLQERVTLLGALDDEMRWRVLREARCIVFPSRWDGPPRPVREALAVGTPAIVSRETNMGDVIQSADAGRVTSNRDDLTLALTETADDQRIAEWTRGANTLRQDLTWYSVAQTYVTAYTSLLAAN